jgi:hypothetical protein
LLGGRDTGAKGQCKEQEETGTKQRVSPFWRQGTSFYCDRRSASVDVGGDSAV